jgi:hypothetical protein
MQKEFKLTEFQKDYPFYPLIWSQIKA